MPAKERRNEVSVTRVQKMLEVLACTTVQDLIWLAVQAEVRWWPTLQLAALLRGPALWPCRAPACCSLLQLHGPALWPCRAPACCSLLQLHGPALWPCRAPACCSPLLACPTRPHINR